MMRSKIKDELEAKQAKFNQNIQKVKLKYL